MKSDQGFFESFWKKKISLPAALLTFSVLLFFAGWQYFSGMQFNPSLQLAVAQAESCPPPSVVKYNLKEFKFVKPLLVMDVLNLGDASGNPLNGIQNGIHDIIESKKQNGQLTGASVYIKQFSTGRFISVNGDERYHPASMMKVPVVMVYFRESELKPALLEQPHVVGDPPNEMRSQYFPPTGQIRRGQKLSFKDLIYHSIVKSDNYADMILGTSMNKTLWSNLFADLELPEPILTNTNFALTAAEYSRFMRILYNATYLSNEHADYVLSLLAQTEFNQGMTRQLPPALPVAHKFGEFGRTGETEVELHESGILYIDNNPILITIMTKGKDMKQLPAVISEISKYVYDQAKTKSGS